MYKTAVEYNDYIVNRQSTIMKKILGLSEIKDDQLDSANLMMDRYALEIEDLITDLKGMPPYKKDSALRDAAIDLFAFYKKTFGNDYKQLIRIRQEGGAMTEEGVAEMNKIVEDISLKESKLDEAFQTAQKNFAKDNNIRLMENKMQKEIDKMNADE